MVNRSSPILDSSIATRENAERWHSITLLMKDGWPWTTIILGLLVMSSFLSATEGTFQGRIVDPPAKEPAAPGWIFVQGRRHLVRRVDVSKAVIVPIPGAPSSQGKKCGPECLAVGQEVRITAVQDASGEWRATRVEILWLLPAARTKLCCWRLSKPTPRLRLGSGWQLSC